MRSLVLSLLLLSGPRAIAAEPKIDTDYFEKTVRPLLVERCQKCHSAKKAKGGLDLSTKAGFLAGGDTGPLVDKAKPEASKFLAVIRYDGDVKMPENGKLPDAEIAVFTKWIVGGAPWPDDGAKTVDKTFDLHGRAAKHWSFQPIVPGNADIDRAIRLRLEAGGLKPAPPAAPEKLLRRLYFDVTGLPPTPEDLAEFQIENYEVVVDRLLKSHDHGVRWARHWLDLARYAETRGHEFDFEIPNAWRYRDYVVRAFNDNLPFDWFVREQVAGDLYPPRFITGSSENQSLIATGFWHLGEAVHSPVDVRQNEADRFDNMIDVFGKTFLGLTISCARCHDHKFDPISTADYYALYGILGSSRYSHEWIGDREKVNAVRKELRKKRKLPDPKPAAKIDGATEDFSGDWRKTWFVDGPAFDAKVGYPHSGRESMNLSGTLRSPTYTIGSRYLAVRVAGKSSDLRLILNNLQLIQSPIYGELKRTVEHGDEFRWVVFDLKMWQGQACYLELIDHGGYAALRELRFGDAPPAPAPKESCDPPPAIPKDDPAIADLEFKLAQTSLLRAPAMVEGTPRNERVFIRGNPKTLGPEVERRFLEALTEGKLKSPKAGSGRKELAEALVDPKNPLVARVFVNRVWQHYFGVGLVPSPDDFGQLGTPPTHPELLDALTAEFVRDGWNVRNLHRRILLSETYRQSATPHPDTAAKAATADPQNKLLHRANVKRLAAEAIRDAMLAVSGRLSTSDGRGVPGRPGVPPHLTEFSIGRGRPGESGPVDGGGARSLYLQVRRNFVNPFFSAFDFPTPFTTIGRRSVSNVPAQALVMLNNPFVLGEADRWAKAMSRLPAKERIDRMYRQAFSRLATVEERTAAEEFVREQAKSIGEPRALAEFAHALFNAKEFVFVE
ncbi:MAG: PSD1 domain-containing protein [Planctomycetia bacterium]|nr:PSD1 domain-containing protein [Planctomycetia bacterium]